MSKLVRAILEKFGVAVFNGAAIGEDNFSDEELLARLRPAFRYEPSFDGRYERTVVLVSYSEYYVLTRVEQVLTIKFHGNIDEVLVMDKEFWAEISATLPESDIHVIEDVPATV